MVAPGIAGAELPRRQQRDRLVKPPGLVIEPNTPASMPYPALYRGDELRRSDLKFRALVRSTCPRDKRRPRAGCCSPSGETE
jgi:hypothetical protein